MNTLNRVLVVLSLLGWIAAIIAGLVQPAASLALLGNIVGWLNSVAVSQWPVLVAAGVGILLACLVLLFFELRRTRRLTVKIQHNGGGVVELATESIARGLEYHLRQVPGVLSVRPVVISTGKAVKLAMDLELDPAVDVPGKTEEIMQLARETIEGKLGVRMARAAVNVRQAEYASREGRDVPVENGVPEPVDESTQAPDAQE